MTPIDSSVLWYRSRSGSEASRPGELYERSSTLRLRHVRSAVHTTRMPSGKRLLALMLRDVRVLLAARPRPTARRWVFSSPNCEPEVTRVAARSE